MGIVPCIDAGACGRGPVPDTAPTRTVASRITHHASRVTTFASRQTRNRVGVTMMAAEYVLAKFSGVP